MFFEFSKRFSKNKKEIIPIDGKALIRANDVGESPIYIVSAQAKESGIVIANKKIKDKSNEITAIPEILKMIDVNEIKEQQKKKQTTFSKSVQNWGLEM